MALALGEFHVETTGVTVLMTSAGAKTGAGSTSG
jgi:hypothetical protein